MEGVVTAYATAFGGALLLGGRLADRLGRRRVFSGGLAAFSAASLACAAAPTATFLVTARAVQGLGAAAVAPAALSLLTTTFREGAERNRALGMFGAATALGFVAGQLLGGVLTDLIGSPAIFVINVPVGVAGALLALCTIPPDGPRAGRQFSDALGALLATAAAAWPCGRRPRAPATAGTPVRSYCRWPPPSCSWRVPGRRIPAPRPAAAARAAHFPVDGHHQRRRVRHRRAQRSRRAPVHPVPPAGPRLQPAGGRTGLPANGGGRVLRWHPARRTAHHRAGVRIVLAVSLFAAAAAVLGLSQLQGGGTYLPLLPWLVAIGASFVTAAVATTVAVSSGVAPDEQGVAAALRQTAFQLGVAIAVAALLSIAASRTTAVLEPAHSSATAATAGQAAAGALRAGYQLALRLCAGLAAVGGLVALACLKRRTPAAPVPEPAEKRLA